MSFHPASWFWLWTLCCFRFHCISGKLRFVGSEVQHWVQEHVRFHEYHFHRQCLSNGQQTARYSWVSKKSKKKKKLCDQALSTTPVASLQVFRTELGLQGNWNSWQNLVFVFLVALVQICPHDVWKKSEGNSWMCCGFLPKTWQMFLKSASLKCCSSAVAGWCDFARSSRLCDGRGEIMLRSCSTLLDSSNPAWLLVFVLPSATSCPPLSDGFLLAWLDELDEICSALWSFLSKNFRHRFPDSCCAGSAWVLC